MDQVHSRGGAESGGVERRRPQTGQAKTKSTGLLGIDGWQIKALKFPLENSTTTKLNIAFLGM